MFRFLYVFVLMFCISAANNDKTKYATKEYWLKTLDSKVNEYGYFEDIDFIFVSDKQAPNLTLYNVKNFSFRQIGTSPALVAKGRGEKMKEGDLTTPIGTYLINNKFTKLDQYYGPLALSTTYPNTYDKSRKRGGSGIWIHGMPLNGNREEQNTRGCVVIENDLLTSYDRQIDWRRSLAIMYEGQIHKTNKDEIATLLANLHRWRDAMEAGNANAFLAFYDKDFKAADSKGVQNFNAAKNGEWQKSKQSLKISLHPISIAVYPSLDQKKLFVIYFTQRMGGKSMKKELYVLLDGENMRIVSEK